MAVHPRYAMYAHCERLIAALQRVADGELQRLMVFMPPRHGKSESVSRLFPAYYLLRHPRHFVGLTSYGADLAYTLSRAARDFYGAGGGTLSRSAGAVKHWETESGGGLWAAGVGGPMTGKGFHLGIIDDPLKDAEEAASSTIRAKQKDWYGATFSTRMEPGAAIVVLQTRWHDDDLSGYLLAMEQDEPEYWHLIDMPALALPPRDDLPISCTLEDDWRPLGAALCPERYSAERLVAIRARISDYYFESLYQQRPRPRTSGMFPLLDTLAQPAPMGAARVRYWDTAGASAGKGDYSAGVLMARDAARWVVEDVVRGQWAAAERNAVIRQTAATDAQRGHVRTIVEQPPGLAKEATEAIVRELAGYVVEADPVRGDKVSRAEPLASQWQAGNVGVVAASWTRAYLDELAAFPFGRYDDQVDASSGAFRHLLDIPVSMPAIGPPRPIVETLKRGFR
jgi:predicted phage terminase large subunit-like protein